MITALINNRAVSLVGLLDNRAVNLIDLEHSTLYFQGLENVGTFFPRVGKCSKGFFWQFTLS